MKILLVDHYDSFTFNLYQLMASLGVEVEVRKWDTWEKEEKWEKWDGIVLSPGPGRPEEYQASRILVQKNYTRMPILGVCLGHQMIALRLSDARSGPSGSSVKHAPRVMHGKTSQIFHDERGLFEGVENPFRGARYHSLILESVPEGFEKSAWTEDGVIMGIRHEKYPLFGVQFHPESFLTEEGEKIMRNFLGYNRTRI